MKQVNVTRRNVNVKSVVGVVILLLCTPLIRLIISIMGIISRGFSGFGTVLDRKSKSRFGQMCTAALA